MAFTGTGTSVAGVPIVFEPTIQRTKASMIIPPTQSSVLSILGSGLGRMFRTVNILTLLSWVRATTVQSQLAVSQKNSVSVRKHVGIVPDFRQLDDAAAGIRASRNTGSGAFVEDGPSARPNARQVFMILAPAGRFLMGPFPPGDLAARFFAAVMRPPRVFFISGDSCGSVWFGAGRTDALNAGRSGSPSTYWRASSWNVRMGIEMADKPAFLRTLFRFFRKNLERFFLITNQYTERAYG